MVGQADSGTAGLELALELKLDVVLMDLIMEAGSGVKPPAD